MNWKNIVSTVAPAIGAVLGGPMGGMAVKYLAESVMGKPDATETDVADFVMGATPETLLKLKTFDREFKVQMKALDIDIDRINAADRDSARSLAKSTTLMPQMTIGVLFVLGYVAILWSVFSGAVVLSEDVKPIAMVLIGTLTAGITQVLNFFLGSSSGSKEKTAKLGGTP